MLCFFTLCSKNQPALEFYLRSAVTVNLIQARTYGSPVLINGLCQPKPKRQFFSELVVEGEVIAEAFVKKSWYRVAI